MLGDISKLSDLELLNIVNLILSRPGPVTSFDETELQQINDEAVRRQRDARGEAKLSTEVDMFIASLVNEQRSRSTYAELTLAEACFAHNFTPRNT